MSATAARGVKLPTPAIRIAWTAPQDRTVAMVAVAGNAEPDRLTMCEYNRAVFL